MPIIQDPIHKLGLWQASLCAKLLHSAQYAALLRPTQAGEQLQKELTVKLEKYVPDPVVTVAVRQSTGYKIYVVGKVNRPGEYPATRTMDVMQALSLAGGPNAFASVNKIKILRRENGELKSLPFKYSRVEKGEDLEQNIVLKGGDVWTAPLELEIRSA